MKQLEKHNGIVIWFTGLSGAGKTSIALALENVLKQDGFFVQLLDGDVLRNGINSNLGFTEEDRIENIRRAAEVAKLFLDAGAITLCCFISPTKEIRHLAKTIVGELNFFEVYVNTPLEVCEARDVKGLYKRARNGEIPNFTGIDALYEIPTDFNFEAKTTTSTISEIVNQLVREIIARIQPLNNSSK